MRIQLLTNAILIGLLTACGGGGSGGSSNNNSGGDVTPQPQPLPTVSIAVVEATAIEKSNQFAKFQIERSNNNQAIEIQYAITGLADNTKGQVSEADYTLVYSDGGNVGDTLVFNNNQNLRVIEVRPTQDNLHEVPEYMVVSLQASTQYQQSSSTSVELKMIDAANTAENAKVFLGVFGPQGHAQTSASGVLSFTLQGDNEQGILNYNFNNLGSEQTDQHIHLAPSGTILKDIEEKGDISNYLWDLAPSGIFTNEQQMLDGLFNGEFYINIHTADYPHGEITATMAYQANVSPPSQNTLTEADVDSDIIRFLNQATYGATPESYQALRNQILPDGSNRMAVYEQWIDAQIALPQTPYEEVVSELVADRHAEEEVTWFVRQDSWWNLAAHAKDQLRQRMAFALSQILVISDDVFPLRNNYTATTNYWDMLARNSFGFYNKTLLDTSLHPSMGIWLSHLQNRKENLELNYFPDENFAREIMQLFSIGLVHRNIDGSLKLDENNLPIPTYNNDVIRNMARVFTGLSFSYFREAELNTFDFTYEKRKTEDAYTRPMKFFPSEHEYGEKTLFTDQGSTLVIPETSEHTEEAAMAELTTVINALTAHKSTAPFISKKLIQRFVTSNPSPEYITRVATAFGSTGDLTATVKAILLDEEARNPNVDTSQSFGKVKEPVLQLTAISRLFNVKSQIRLNDGNGFELSSRLRSYFDDDISLLRFGDIDIGQQVLAAPSVFNFFQPEFSPPGELSLNALVAPELQLLNETQLFNTYNFYDKLLDGHIFRTTLDNRYTLEQLAISFDKTVVSSQWQSTAGSNREKAIAVVDYIDFYLNAGQLKQTENMATREYFIEALSQESSRDKRFELAVYGAATLPEFMVHR